ncbi:unnamed protein product [Linum trigynum]|uniref:glucan endo-1,3-beta-D-glucosidase n=1 Tax=Linum trigynum TaxID=586398 RepID=A0AAV2GCI7_9ROSI
MFSVSHFLYNYDSHLLSLSIHIDFSIVRVSIKLTPRSPGFQSHIGRPLAAPPRPPFYQRSKIATISVGEDVVAASKLPFMLPAIRNVHLALRDIGIKSISVSTTFSFINIVTTAFPPSAATFKEPIGKAVIRPLLPLKFV